jgi:penicillin V acylase-like amidase (Ntn superfamily)
MCTRILYETGTGTHITGRGMDWNDPTATTRLHSFPRGLARTGAPVDNAIAWTSKYGSVVASFYDAATADGMNEQGLVANVLYLTEADFGDATASSKPVLSIGAWAQYFLDLFATVAEAVEAMQDPPFVIVAPMLPNGRAAAVHMSLSDPSGDSAILEYLGGELVIHHGSEYVTMTNSPTYDQQLAINAYWELIGGDRMLPGTINAADRYVRVDYLLKASPKYDDPRMAVASVFSVMRAIGVPLGMEDPDHPNISATLWRTIADHSARRYYFESTIQPAVIWVDIDSLDLSEGASPTEVLINGPTELAGDVVPQMQPAEPYGWLWQ